MLHSLLRQDVLHMLEKEFGFSSDEAATKLSTVDEHIRAALLIESQRSTQKQIAPVSTVTITRTVRARLAPLWPDLVENVSANDIVLSELRQMKILGEVENSDSHHWIPTPDRTIWIDESTRLLISASPLSTLQLRTRKALQVIGRARLIHIDKATVQMLPPLQRLENWLGCPHDEIEKWSKAFITQTARTMRPVEQFDDLKIFYDGRWRAPKDLAKQMSKVHLYRRKILIYGNPTDQYGLCKLQAGRDGDIQVISSQVIQRDDARRLQGFMSLASGQEQKIRYEKRGSIAVLELRHPLPAPEHAFLSLGWELGKQNSNPWPKQLAFSTRLVPFVTRALRLLGYKLVEHTNGGTRNAES